MTSSFRPPVASIEYVCSNHIQHDVKGDDERHRLTILSSSVTAGLNIRSNSATCVKNMLGIRQPDGTGAVRVVLKARSIACSHSSH